MHPGYSTNSGFSLLELVAVILVLAILAIGASSRFGDSSNFATLTTRDDIVAGLFYAQQIAQARGDINTIQFISTGNRIDIHEDGSSIGNGIYPLTLPPGFTLTTATFSYDKLGRTTAGTLTLTDGDSSATIHVSATGYAN